MFSTDDANLNVEISRYLPNLITNILDLFLIKIFYENSIYKSINAVATSSHIWS